uniref:Glycerophosphocholine acyltransferase 1 n=1 Tax=Candidozyma auris TaxID=498019 RepID=A0A0L0NP76_CANAR
MADSAETSGHQPLSVDNLTRKNQMEASLSAIDDEDVELDDRSSYSSSKLARSDSSLSVSFIDLSKLLLMPDFDFGNGFDHVSDSTKKKFKDMKDKTRQTFKKFTPDGKVSSRKFTAQELAKYQESLHARLTKFDNRVHESLQSSSTEKLFYAAAVALVASGGFIIGKYPIYFPVFHTVLFCLLMPIRFYTYFKLSFQYYLADLCYYVNLLVVLFIWAFPQSESLFISCFSLTLGTLCFAVITWRNSLVLHSIEKTTSSFIHIMPPITMFVIVHELPEAYVAERYPGIANIEKWDFANGVVWTCIYYTIWQVCYHYFITVRKRAQIAKGKVTSFTYLKHKNSDSVLGRFVNSLPYTWMQIAAFTLIQFGYQMLTMLPCPIWFKYKHACGGFVAFIFVWSAYNGATYYIEVFGKRFEKEVNRLKSEIMDLQQKVERQEKLTPQFLPLNGSTLSSTDNIAELNLLEKKEK